MENGVLSHTNMVTQAHLGEVTHKFIKIDEWPLQVQSVTVWITPYRTTCCSETDQNGVEGQNIYVMGENIHKKNCKSISVNLLAPTIKISYLHRDRSLRYFRKVLRFMMIYLKFLNLGRQYGGMLVRSCNI